MAKSNKINWGWVLISMVIFLVAQILVTIVSPLIVIFTFGLGLLILKPLTYFICGLLTGFLSPGITILEPAIGAAIIAVLGTIFDVRRGGHGLLAMVIAGVVAYFCALAGAKIGEKMQHK